MKLNYIKLGPKQRHLVIPVGYREVDPLEHIWPGDLCANIHQAIWQPIEESDIGLSVEESCIDHVIRKIVS